MGHGDQAHVLTEGGDGGTAEHTAGDSGEETVRAKRTGDLLRRNVTAETAGTGGGGVADGLHRGYDKHQTEGQNRADTEHGPEGEELWDSDYAHLANGVAHGAEIHHTEEDRHHIPHQHAQQDVELFGNTLEGGMEHQRCYQCDGGNQQILPGAQRISAGGAEGRHADA